MPSINGFAFGSIGVMGIYEWKPPDKTCRNSGLAKPQAIFTTMLNGRFDSSLRRGLSEDKMTKYEGVFTCCTSNEFITDFGAV